MQETIEVINNKIKITSPQSRLVSIEDLTSERDMLQLKVDKLNIQILEASNKGAKIQSEYMTELRNKNVL